MEETDVVILGGGLAGLAAGSSLGKQAIVLESEERPGGLVRTANFDGYWFDRVIHLLYFSDPDTESRIRALLGDELAWCPPEAWVETAHGTIRFPFQTHLGGLAREVVVDCIRDLAEAAFKPHNGSASNFEEALLGTFGRGMCEAFLFPYNRKVWKRPLDTLAPSCLGWNITPPEFRQVVRGALNPDRSFEAYNSKGWYPRPAKGAAVRGMEVLSQALASEVADLRLHHTVDCIDLQARVVYARHRGELLPFHFLKACCSTLPLPRTLEICRQTPDSLRKECERLVYNRVLSVALCIEGPRPEGRGHWRYYADPTLIFNRLTYIHAFDSDNAPETGWGVLAEITQPAEEPIPDENELLQRVQADAKRAGTVPAGCKVIGSQLMVADPAYVVFTVDTQGIAARARSFLERHCVTALGRYGSWGYMSMSQVMRDGFAWGNAVKAGLNP